MRVNLAFQQFQPGSIQTFLHFNPSKFLFMKTFGYLIFLLQRVNMPFGGMFHLIECLDQLAHLILILNRHVIAAEIIPGNLPGTVGQPHHWVNQGVGQKLGQTDDGYDHHNGVCHDHGWNIIQDRNFLLITALSLFQGGLHQPSGISLEIPLHAIHFIKLVHKAPVLRVHVKHLIPEHAVAFISIFNIPCPGIAFLVNVRILKRQRFYALLSLKAGQPVLLGPFPGAVPYVLLKSRGLLFQRLLHIVTKGIIVQYYIKAVQGKIHD